MRQNNVKSWDFLTSLKVNLCVFFGLDFCSPSCPSPLPRAALPCVPCSPCCVTVRCCVPCNFSLCGVPVCNFSLSGVPGCKSFVDNNIHAELLKVTIQKFIIYYKSFLVIMAILWKTMFVPKQLTDSDPLPCRRSLLDVCTI